MCPDKKIASVNEKEAQKRKASTDKSNAQNCHVCKKHITESVAITSEGKDYIWHFCDQKCYESYKNNKQKYDPK
ncbi:MAG: DUF3330 domain-containing protein [Proteobacteria bacterium]|nr:DUF3330 domain-containing protein [Pseudomonadota bacterium]